MKKSLLISIIVAVIVIVLLGGLAVILMQESGAKGSMDQIITIEETYLQDRDSFNTAYNSLYERDYSISSNIQKGRAEIVDARVGITSLNDSVNGILKISNEKLTSTEDTQKQWFENLDMCYDLRQEHLTQVSIVLDNYEKYIGYNEELVNLLAALNELGVLAVEFDNQFIFQEDNVKAKEVQQKMDVEMKKLETSQEKLIKIIPLSSDAQFNEWMGLSREEVDKLAEIFTESSSTRQMNLYEEYADISTKTIRVVNDWATAYEQELPEWSIENIEDPDKIAGDKITSSDDSCDEAANLWEEAYY